MNKRILSLLVDNTSGVLSRVAGLFSRRGYNITSLTVGETAVPEYSRMTVVAEGDEQILEQIKKQLNAMIEVIKVVDLTTMPIHMKEILYAKVNGLDGAGKTEAFQIAEVFDQGGNVRIVDIGADSVLFECTLTERKNNELIALLKSRFKKIEVTRGGAVAVESISSSCR